MITLPLMLVLFGCTGSLSTTSTEDFDSRLAALEAAGADDNAELLGRVAALEAALADQLDTNDALHAELDGLAQRLELLEEAGSPDLAARVDELAADVDDLATWLELVDGNVSTLLANGPAVWSLVEDFPTNSVDVYAWEPIHAQPLAVDLTGGPVVASCWVNSVSSSRRHYVRISLVDSTGTTHTSSVAGDETRSDGTTVELIDDEQIMITGTFSNVAAGPAEVNCEGYYGMFWTVELTVVDLGI